MTQAEQTWPALERPALERPAPRTDGRPRGRAPRPGRRTRVLLLAGLLVMAGLTLVSFTFRMHEMDQTSLKMAGLERSLAQLKAAMNVDSIRLYQIQKIIAIIESYNSTMSSELKYAIADEICRMAVKYPNLNIDLICATITHESALSWSPEAVSPAGALGLMQIMPATGVFLAADEGIPWTEAQKVLFDPIVNIRLGCRYLSALITMYEVDGGLAAYNGGERRAAMWLASGRDDSILWEETRGYVPAVLKLYKKFQQ